MAERRLSITADDLGASTAINRGIADSVRNGTVSAVSVLANGPALLAAVEVVSGRVAFGVHINFTEGKAVALPDQVRSLVRIDGKFFSLPMLLLRTTVGIVRPDDVLRESAAQIERLRAIGFPVSYADSHQHVHVLPRLAGPIAKVVRGAGLIRIRQPVDREPGPSALKAWAVATVARRSAHHFLAFSRPVATRGIACRPTTFDHLESILASLPVGLSELIVHPRAPGPAEPGEARLFDLDARQAEWETLTDARALALLARYRIQLVTPNGNQLQMAFNG